MNIFKITILFIILFFICIKTNAAPAISSISGSISHGSSITINGTGFGVKSPAAPYIWANFDDGSSQPSSLGQIHRSEEHTSELQSHHDLVCRLLLEKKKKR